MGRTCAGGLQGPRPAQAQVRGPTLHDPGSVMHSPVSVRPAREADLPACAGIINDYIDTADWLPRLKSRDEIAAVFAPDILALRTILVAEVAGQVAGYLSLGGGGHVAALYLAPEARRQGVGRALMAEAKALNPGGLTLTVFEPNLGARAFYAREGFAEVPERRDDSTEEGVPALWLRWPGVGE